MVKSMVLSTRPGWLALRAFLLAIAPATTSGAISPSNKSGEVTVIDVYRIMRARSNENCVKNNNHYLCSAKKKPQGTAGYEVLVNYLLNHLCTEQPDSNSSKPLTTLKT